MTSAQELTTTLLPGAARLLELHARELPQRDDLCGAFCGALALGAAGLDERDGEPLDQDAVALAAGSVVSGAREPGVLPARRERTSRLPPGDADDRGLRASRARPPRACAKRSSGSRARRCARSPSAARGTARRSAALFDAAAVLERPVTLIANLATHHLWGSRASLAQLLAYLLDGTQDGPPPDWRVGHFACVVGRVRGPAGELYAIADTYPALGRGGVHVQPRERLAAALERRDMPAGGVLAVLAREDAAAVRDRGAAAGLREGMWDNGTVSVSPGPPA